MKRAPSAVHQPAAAPLAPSGVEGSSRNLGGTEAFKALGVAPTLDLGAIKRAYFELLKTCPPHLDPERFSRLRHAYEPLSTPAGLAAAYFSAPMDFAVEVARRRAQVQPDIEAGIRRLKVLAERTALLEAFVAAMKDGLRRRKQAGSPESRSLCAVEPHLAGEQEVGGVSRIPALRPSR